MNVFENWITLFGEFAFIFILFDLFTFYIYLLSSLIMVRTFWEVYKILRLFIPVILLSLFIILDTLKLLFNDLINEIKITFNSCNFIKLLVC